MKSVIEEGPSIAKAIEQGWIKAGKPKEFSVKIFQEPKKNFFGMTTTIAKVGIFFRDLATPENKDFKTQSEQRPQYSQQQRYQQRPYYKKKKYGDKNQRDFRDRDNRRRYPQKPYKAQSQEKTNLENKIQHDEKKDKDNT